MHKLCRTSAQNPKNFAFMNFQIRCCAYVALGVATACLPKVSQAQTAELREGLEALFQTAENHNATLQSLRSALVEAEAGIKTARAEKLPDIEGQVSVSYLGNARLWNRHFGESTSAAMPHYGNNFFLGVNQVVYSGGAVTGGITLAEQAAEMSGLSEEEGRQNMHFLLTSLYLQLHNLKNREQVYAANADLARNMIALMQNRYEQGVSLHNDITRYELQLQEMQLGQTTMANGRSIVEHELYTALGTDSSEVKLLGEEAFSEGAVSIPIEADWQQLAVINHIGLKKSELGVDMSRTQEKLTFSEMLPKVALLAEDHLYGPITTEVPPINKNLHYWFVGVGVSYDFSSLYKSKKKVKQSRLATTLAQDEHTVALQQVGDAVHAAYVDLGTARTELETRNKSVELAAENYDVVSRRYQNGMALITDLTDAANIKLDAELALANARINFIYAYYNLKYVSGDL